MFAQSCTGYCHAAKGGGGGGAPTTRRARIRSAIHQKHRDAWNSRYGHAGVCNDAVARRPLCSRCVCCNVEWHHEPCAAGIEQPGSGRRSKSNYWPEAARGRDLFYDATRSFGRCSTCHEVNGQGIPVTAPISKVPDDGQALRALATPLVSTATMNGETMPALVVSKGARSVIFYDLTTSPPVLVTAGHRP